MHPDLARYQDALGAAYAFQAALEMPYEDVDVFRERRPVVVPARTLLGRGLFSVDAKEALEPPLAWRVQGGTGATSLGSAAELPDHTMDSRGKDRKSVV